jgi:hypothetical protein
MRGQGVQERPCVHDTCDAVALGKVAEITRDEEVGIGSFGAFEEAIVGFVGRDGEPSCRLDWTLPEKRSQKHTDLIGLNRSLGRFRTVWYSRRMPSVVAIRTWPEYQRSRAWDAFRPGERMAETRTFASKTTTIKRSAERSPSLCERRQSLR